MIYSNKPQEKPRRLQALCVVAGYYANLAEFAGTTIAIQQSMINQDKLTVKSSEALNDAANRARQNGNPLVYDLHLLLALLEQNEGIVVPILQKVGVNVSALREAITREVGRYAKQTDAQPSLSRELNQVLDRSEQLARQLSDEYVSTEHLLLALSDVKVD